MDVLDLLHDLNQRGRTIVMVLHDLNQACRYADCLVAIRDGSIYAHGAPADVVTVEMVEAVFGLTARIVPDPVTGTPMCVPISRTAKGAQTSSNGTAALENERTSVPARTHPLPSAGKAVNCVSEVDTCTL